MRFAKFIKENAVLITGVTLPLVVVVFFLAAIYIPRLLVDPPQYDFLFTSSHYDYQNAPPIKLHISITEGQLRANLYKTNNQNAILKLFLFEHESQSVRELPIEIPKIPDDIEEGQEVLIKEVADMKISTNRRAPDGYEFAGNRSRGIGLFGELFFGGRGNPNYAITKNGASIRIPTVDSYYYYGVNFLGWVVED